MSDALKGKNAVVTGGAGGIGSWVCKALGSAGANVVVNDVGAARDGSGINREPVEKVVNEIKKSGGNAIANFDSVSDFNAAEKLIKTCVDTFGRIDILVNLHGNLRDRMIWNMTEDEWDSVITVHLKGTFNTCRHACVRMREQKYGRIINVTSDAWRRATGHVNYAAAKGGVVSLTKSIAMEMGKYGVTANSFAPIAATRMTVNEDVKAGLLKRVEQGMMTRQEYEATIVNMPQPQCIAPLIVYLASDKAANINGRVFHIEKGRVSIYSEPAEERVLYKTEMDGLFTFEELEQVIPTTLLEGYVNPAPPQQANK